jgi:hypothetical protein
MALLLDDREKTSETLQSWLVKFFYKERTVFPFFTIGTGIVSLLLHAVIDSAQRFAT